MANEQDPNLRVAWTTKQELDNVISSKEHFMALFAVKGGYLLPPKQFITWRFIRSILKGEKRLVKLSNVPTLYIPPKVTDLTVRRLWEQIGEDNRISVYMPETNRTIDRKYFFQVLSAVLPNFYETIVIEVLNSRRREITEEQKVKIVPEMEQLLANGVPYVREKRPVGRYLCEGRQWSNNIERRESQLDVRRLF